MAEELAKADCIIIGAGAAGLMCALTAAKRGKKVILLERNRKPGAKILISGGGRCNFTNLDVTAEAYLSQNPHFAKSALSRYGPYDFMDMLARNGGTWHEKTLGQLFCDQGSRKILDMLLAECQQNGVLLKTEVEVKAAAFVSGGYLLDTNLGDLRGDKLVLATGGMSIPKMGATDFAYRIARKFGANIVEPAPALVPLVFGANMVADMKTIAGVSALCSVGCGNVRFRENLLFTHRGLSGPAILQISSYWQKGQHITINLLPEHEDILGWLKDQRRNRPKAGLAAILRTPLAERLADWIAKPWPGNLADMSNTQLLAISKRLGAWHLTPTGSEGFKKAEVTKGGVSTQALSSKTMELKHQAGLYFIGECVDVTGWLGGYNFQWAWASGHACGLAI